jgi:hypothetical protein
VYSNKKRLVWDARALNELIDVEKIYLESLDDAAELLEENFFGATSDLEAGYFQVGLAEEQRTLLGCAFENPDTGCTTYFVSNTMILGERSAVHSFTRLLKPVVKTPRLEGHSLRRQLRAHRQEQRRLRQKQENLKGRGKTSRVAVQRSQGAGA